MNILKWLWNNRPKFEHKPAGALNKFYARGKLNDPRASMMERILSYLFIREEIPTRTAPHSLYLRRFKILALNWFRIYLHVFYRSDDDPDPHCHPWSFVSAVLRGGYLDETWQEIKASSVYGLQRDIVVRCFDSPKRTFGSVSFRPGHHIHRARLLDPNRRTWTLIISGPRYRSWYFYTPEGRVPGNEYTGPVKP